MEAERPGRWARRITVPGLAPSHGSPPQIPTVVAQTGAPQVIRAGIQLGHHKVYDVVECIGEGGMGRIFRAYDPAMDRYVALKLLKPDMPDYVRKRFRREAVIAANFSHPNLPRVLDVGNVDGSGAEWMTMEYLRGRDLGRVIERGRPIPVPLLVDIFCQTLDALDYIHTRKIVHCDVKPDNVFITRDSYDRRIVIIKLIDFGVSRSIEHGETVEQIAGDPLYMAPEQTLVNERIDGRADLYALGMSFYETLTGRHPWQEYIDAPVEKLLELQRDSEPPPPSSRLPPGPPRLVDALDDVFATACAKNPARRYKNARAMRKAMMGLRDLG
ncbi:MAG TPA: serine/threonine-protein kinase [Nannocystaceae bacterium]|nr:serine/threonine-protein kinase [Nannocystaceae bacterium]